MKRIKLYEEFYHRTVGYRYSEPTIRIAVTCYYTGVITLEDVNKILSDINKLTFDTVSVGNTPGSMGVEKPVEVQNDEGDESAETTSQEEKFDGEIKFDILVYDDREVDKIMTDFSKTLYLDYDVKIVDA